MHPQFCMQCKTNSKPHPNLNSTQIADSNYLLLLLPNSFIFGLNLSLQNRQRIKHCTKQVFPTYILEFSRHSSIQIICDRDLILQIKSFQKTSKIRSYFKQTIQNLSIFFYMFSIQIIFDQIPNKPFKIRSHSTDHSKPTIQVLRVYSSNLVVHY